MNFNINFTDWLLKGKADNDNDAVLWGGKRLTYAELCTSVNKLKDYLLSLGLNKGNSVLLIADNSFFFIISYLATMTAGCISVPIERQTAPNRIAYIKEKTMSRAIFIQDKFAGLLDSSSSVLGFTHVMSDSQNKGHVDIFNLPDFEIPEAKTGADNTDYQKKIAVIIFTSGSSGQPKGVMLTHRNLQANTQSIIEYLRMSNEDRIMVVLPFAYCYGASLLHTSLAVGGSVALNNEFMFPEKVLKQLNEFKCTGFAGVPSTYQILLRKTSFKSMKFPSLRFLAQAGGKLPTPCIQELRELFSDDQIFIMYGQTEATARLSYLPPEMLGKKTESIGRGIPGTQIDVFDDKGKPAPPGVVGEIVARGDNIMLGYLDDPEGTALKIRKGVLFTGDLGKKDEDSFIYLVGRQSEMIKISGYRVSPKEIEETIMKIPSVVEAAVIGLQDDILGETAMAFVVLNKKIGERQIGQEDIIQFCKKNLPIYMVPKVVKLVDEIPKNYMGKTTYDSIKNMRDSYVQEKTLRAKIE